MSAAPQPPRNPGAPSEAVARTESPKLPLWEFVPLANYTVPGLPASSAAANAWTSLKRLLRTQAEEAAAPVKAEAELRVLSQVRLAHLVAPLDWSAVAQTLSATLRPWALAPEAEPTIRFVIGQPHCGHADILRNWSAQASAPVVAPPSHAQILAADRGWLEHWPDPARPWVLPNLERCFLRHARGLTLVRDFLERAESGRLGRGLIGCDSWGWAYLQRIWPVPRPDALTLQAFDGLRLAQLFTQMANAREGVRIRFRNAATGDDILTVPARGAPVRLELIQLAAHCRGNVGTAHRYWRERLRAEPEPDADVVQPAADEEGIWVSPTPLEPALPLEQGEEAALLLHALLLHGALPEGLLPDMLPLSAHRCMALLLRLRSAGLAQLQDQCWSVPALAYASVRHALRNRGYLTDDF